MRLDFNPVEIIGNECISAATASNGRGEILLHVKVGEGNSTLSCTLKGQNEEVLETLVRAELPSNLSYS